MVCSMLSMSCCERFTATRHDAANFKLNIHKVYGM